MMKSYLLSEYLVERDQSRCIRCQVCVNQCTYETHHYDAEDDIVSSQHESCTNCQRCVVFCPTHAITIQKNPTYYKTNAHWSYEAIRANKKQPETGGVLLTGMGCDKP
ncbi:MAG: 4Fe-4S binding protein, partial [Candidatus Bathyarchaeota archaeon]